MSQGPIQKTAGPPWHPQERRQRQCSGPRRGGSAGGWTWPGAWGHKDTLPLLLEVTATWGLATVSPQFCLFSVFVFLSFLFLWYWGSNSICGKALLLPLPTPTLPVLILFWKIPSLPQTQHPGIVLTNSWPALNLSDHKYLSVST